MVFGPLPIEQLSSDLQASEPKVEHNEDNDEDNAVGGGSLSLVMSLNDVLVLQHNQLFLEVLFLPFSNYQEGHLDQPYANPVKPGKVLLLKDE